MTRSNAIYADETVNSAYLNTVFGQKLALQKLDLSLEQLEEIVGRYTKGKRKGQLRGKLMWRKVINGGWVRGVGVTPKCTYGYHIVDAYTEETIYGDSDLERQRAALVHSRMQPLVDEHQQREKEEEQAKRENILKTHEAMIAQFGVEYNIEPLKEDEHSSKYFERFNSWMINVYCKK